MFSSSSGSSIIMVVVVLLMNQFIFFMKSVQWLASPQQLSGIRMKQV